ncbi:MAG: matrixin family metalloprotease [Planctomycetes bacterium]|nr:matrixin family metalloprotease [Planctomycetota bacterium]
MSLSTLGLGDDSTVYEADANDLFERAESVDVTGQSRVIRGAIDGEADVDVYDLGPSEPGDRILVEMAAADTLDAALALFDGDGLALLINDHRNVYLGKNGPFIDLVLRRYTTATYVTVAATPGYSAFGEYGLVASRERQVPLPLPHPDTVLLVFDGGSQVQVGTRQPIDVPLFDAADIDPSLEGTTAELVAGIVDAVRADYVPYNVTILSTSEGARYDGSSTRLFFGTYDAALLGVAEGVDEFNATKAQEAIVFTDTFEAFMELEPTVPELAQAIGNVASHEVGHLLGLVHTADPLAIMDVTASLYDLMDDQRFRQSPLHSLVYPLGAQDSVEYLLDAVGGDPAFALLKDRYDTRARRAPSGPAARSFWLLSSCNLDERPAGSGH